MPGKLKKQQNTMLPEAYSEDGAMAAQPPLDQ